MGKTYGYCRVSTKQQSLARQETNILNVCEDAKIYEEKYTGTKIDGRIELDKLVKRVEAGDTIIFDSVSRMSRNAKEGMKLYRELFEKGVELVFLNEPHVNTSVYREALQKQINISTSTGDNATDKFISSIIEALKQFQMDLAEKQIELAFDQAQKEAEDISSRIKQGIREKRREAVERNEPFEIGAKKGERKTTKKSIEAKEIILKHAKCFGGKLSNRELLILTGISRNTLYKYKRELKEEN